jgi:hypothetical protein
VEPVNNNPTVSQQIAALDLMREMAYARPDLPAPYVVVGAYSHGATYLSVQCSTPGAFEAWRVALDLPSDLVTLQNAGGDDYLRVDAKVSQIEVCLTGHGLVAAAEAVAA